MLGNITKIGSRSGPFYTYYIGGYFDSVNGQASALNICKANNKTEYNNIFGTGFDDGVQSIVVQDDNKIIVGGQHFTQYNGTTTNRITRLNSDGTIDSSFNSGSGFNGQIRDILLLNNGQILVCGGFNSYNGITIPRGIARLNSDGTLDSSFNSGGSGLIPSLATRMAVQNDGKIIVTAMQQGQYNGANVKRVFRLNSNGTLDTIMDFDLVLGSPLDIKIQNDGKILVVGGFLYYDIDTGNSASSIIRLNSDLSVDSESPFGSGFYTEGSTRPTIYSIVLQPDNKILVGGNPVGFYNGFPFGALIRLNNDGSIDSSFNVGGGLNGTVLSIALQKDNKIVVGGNFTEYNGSSVTGLARLNTDGSLDTTFLLNVNWTDYGPQVDKVVIK